MNRRQTFAIGTALVAIISWSSVHAEQRPGACITCHEFLGGDLAVPVKEWTGSIHQQNGIACAQCHGGNPSVVLGNIKQLSSRQFEDKKAAAMSKSRGFIGKPAGKAMFNMCAQCHPDSVDRYARSIMGKAYLDGTGGPSCVICHGAHNNRMPQVPKACESCHKDTTGFDQIDPMNVTQSTVSKLSGIRIKLAQKKAFGEPPFIPEFPEDLEAFQIGFVAFGAVIVLFFVSYLVYIVFEKRR